jgi:N-acetylglucosamine-6-sulfatase
MVNHSFLLLKGEKTEWRDHIFYEYFWERPFPHTPTVFGVRTDKYKYMTYHGIWDIDELYDIETDPKEKYNLIDSPDHQDLKKSLIKKYMTGLNQQRVCRFL